MPESVRSVVTLCAEQKLVPELPIRQLSRTLSGVAAHDDDAAAAKPARVAVAARAVLFI
jgi:hypothetical protein